MVRTLGIVALVLLCAVTLLLLLGSYVIPMQFETGKRHWMWIPFRMLMPSFVWTIAWVGALGAAGGVGLALLFWRAGHGQWGAALVISLVVAVADMVAVGMAVGYIRRVTAPHAGFVQAFGQNWAATVPPGLTDRMLQHRWSPRKFATPTVPVERDVAFWTIPSTERQLLADLWLPPADVKPTGVAFLFFHGSAWHFSDKGVGMDPTFKHLAAQGHVVMDVAYRLAPEVDITGMVTDVKRSVAWMKQNAARYGVDPERIVIGGSSAGGHISLLTAYGDADPAFAADDLAGQDTRVAGVVSYYGPVDMRAYVEHQAGKLGITGKRVTEKKAISDVKGMPTEGFSTEQMMMNLLGGMPEDVPAMYDLAAVTTHIKPGASNPAALIVQGEYDFITQTRAVRTCVQSLRQAGVPVVYLELPETDHGFDIITSLSAVTGAPAIFGGDQYAPPTTAALYDLDRFLGLVAGKKPT